jgi:erythromycin esterase-like protein
MRQVLFILLSIAYPILGYAQFEDISYNDKYRLDFDISRKDSTTSSFVRNNAYLQIGCMAYMNKEHKYEEVFTLPTSMSSSFRSVIRNRILLPDVQRKKRGEISLEVKGNEIENLSIILQGLDNRENVMFEDTLRYVPDTCYTRFKGCFSLENIELLDVKIDAEGEQGKKSKISYSGLDIKIDGKSINDFPIRHIPDMIIEKDRLIATDDEIGEILGNVKEFNGKKILGIGESVHHHEGIKKFAFRIMEEGIKKFRCRLIAFEMPISASLYFNRYISDTSFILPKELLEDERIKEYLFFFDNLRHYNSQCSYGKRVRLLGMDYNTYQSQYQNSSVDLFDFLSYINKDKRNYEADILSVMLYDNRLADALEYLKTHKQELEKVMTEDEVLCMEYILSFSIRMNKDNITRILLRDSVMMENISFMEKAFVTDSKDRIMVYAHALHLNKLSAYPADNYRSAGKFLYEKYGDDYASFLLVSDRGEFKAQAEFGIIKNSKLQLPCAGSMEKALNMIGKKFCYVPVTDKDEQIVLSRFTGLYDSGECQFFPFNLYRRYDGVFYVKGNEVSWDNTTEAPKNSLDKGMEVLERIENKIKKRKAITNEIRNRCKI